MNVIILAQSYTVYRVQEISSTDFVNQYHLSLSDRHRIISSNMEALP